MLIFPLFKKNAFLLILGLLVFCCICLSCTLGHFSFPRVFMFEALFGGRVIFGWVDKKYLTQK